MGVRLRGHGARVASWACALPGRPAPGLRNWPTSANPSTAATRRRSQHGPQHAVGRVHHRLVREWRGSRLGRSVRYSARQQQRPDDATSHGRQNQLGRAASRTRHQHGSNGRQARPSLAREDEMRQGPLIRPCRRSRTAEPVGPCRQPRAAPAWTELQPWQARCDRARCGGVTDRIMQPTTHGAAGSAMALTTHSTSTDRTGARPRRGRVRTMPRSRTALPTEPRHQLRTAPVLTELAPGQATAGQRPDHATGRPRRGQPSHATNHARHQHGPNSSQPRHGQAEARQRQRQDHGTGQVWVASAGPRRQPHKGDAWPKGAGRVRHWWAGPCGWPRKSSPDWTEESAQPGQRVPQRAELNRDQPPCGSAGAVLRNSRRAHRGWLDPGGGRVPRVTEVQSRVRPVTHGAANRAMPPAIHGTMRGSRGFL